MTDLPASWRSDPTGRHDHRYWDGTRWTDHVADAGVAGTDPYTEPPAAPAAEPPSTPSPASSEPASALSWDPSTATSPTAAGASQPDAGAADADAGDATDATPSGWSRPSEPGTPEPEGPTETSPIAGWAPSPSTGWSTDTTEVTPAATAAAAPTEVTPTVDDSPLPDLSNMAGIPGLGGDAADTVPPVGPDAAGGSGGSRRNVLIALGILAVVAVVAFLALSGDDDDLGSSAISNRLAESLQEDSNLSDDDADCVADHIVEQVGPERMQDVDLTSGTAPEGDLGSDFVEAYADAVRECDVSSFSADGDDDGSSDPGSDVTIPDVGNLESFRDLLADQYEKTLGLPREKADCLADAMGEAVSKGELDQQDAFGNFFDYLESCDISFSELTDS